MNIPVSSFVIFLWISDISFIVVHLIEIVFALHSPFCPFVSLFQLRILLICHLVEAVTPHVQQLR